MRKNQDGTERELTGEEALHLFKILIRLCLLAYQYAYDNMTKEEKEKGSRQLKEELEKSKSQPQRILDTVNKLADTAVRKRNAKQQRKDGGRQRDEYED